MKSTRPRINLKAISELAELADYSFAFAIRAVAAIGVADYLSGGPQHIDYLTQETACNRHGLIRVMRALVTRSVFAEVDAETFALTPIGDLLRTDHPLSMRWFFRLEPDVQAIAGLEYSIRTGMPSFDDLFGMRYFDWMAANEAPRERFRESQRALNRLELLAITRSYRWREIRSMVDVGGNDGSLVAELLRLHPSLVGTVFDLPDTIIEASKTFKIAGFSDRATVVAGNVFEGGIPHGADLYSIKRVLVGFSDEEAIIALSSIREAMMPHSRLLIMEPMRGTADQVGVSLDLLMLVLGLGRVRAPQEFGELLANAGLKVIKMQNAGLVTILEAGVTDE
jgi:hypothetical protein